MHDATAPFQINVNDHVHLSAFCRDDKSALVEFLNDKDIYDRTLRIPFPYTEADADKFLGIAGDAAESHGHAVHFAIRNEQGKAIGGCGFDGLVHGHRAELGYWLAKPYWGRGMMTEVVTALCDFAFAEWKLVRICAHVFSFNEASAKVLSKNGFELEGVLRKRDRKDGKFIDTRLYALVK